MRRLSHLYLFTFIVASCSILYELLLGQALSAFMGDTVLRFSVTIGLYLFSMGIGALLAGERITKHVVLSLLFLELLLATIGGGSIIALHIFQSLGLPTVLFSALAHLLIIIIGLLTGAELPLLIEMQRLGAEKLRKRPDEKTVIGINYLGALVGTVSFAFIIYPGIGILPGALWIGFLNAAAGLMLISALPLVSDGDRKRFKRAYSLQGAIALILFVAIMNADSLSSYFLAQYLGAGS